MLRLLLATDGSEDAARAARHVADLARHGMAIEVVLCNVEPPVMSGEVGALAPIEIAERRRTLAARAAFDSARLILEGCGAAISEHEESGDAADEILAAAKALHCDAIVIGRRGLGKLASLVAGSVSSQVLRKSPLPVTLVP